MSTPVTPGLGDIQKKITDRMTQIRARITELKGQLPFTPPGFLDQQPILSRTRQGGQGLLRGSLLQNRPLLKSMGLCPGCGTKTSSTPPQRPNLMRPAIVDIGATAASPSGAAVAEDIDPTHQTLSIAR